MQQYLGEPAYKRLITSHYKNLNQNDFLVVDRLKNGAKDFKGEWIHFGSEEYPDWASALKYLKQKI